MVDVLCYDFGHSLMAEIWFPQGDPVLSITCSFTHGGSALCFVSYSLRRFPRFASLVRFTNSNNAGYSSSLRYLLPRQRWWLKPDLSSLHAMVRFIGQCAHEMPFLKALPISQGIKNQLQRCLEKPTTDAHAQIHFAIR